ncbi:MAG: SHOCT domain-containing protein [Desulfuromonas sp.]|nr:SHOCT domain-containing protein [Desulfuromonas sp.]
MAESSGDDGIAKNIFIGYFVLILHVLLLVILGFFIVFFRGLVVYMPWILGGGLALLCLSGYWFYRRMKRGAAGLKQTLSDNVPDRPMEVSLLGGLASVRVGVASPGRTMVENAPLQLEDPETSRLRSLERLADMYNKGLISKEEFALLKQDVLQPTSQSETAEPEVIDVDFSSH